MISKLAAVLLLMQPRGFFVLEQGWTEPLAICMLALTLFRDRTRPGARRMGRWAADRHEAVLVLAVPLLWRFAAGRPGLRGFVVRAVVVGALVTLPFVIWSPRAFIESVLLLQLREPVRLDSLSCFEQDCGSSMDLAPVRLGLGSRGSNRRRRARTMLVTPNTPAGLAAPLAFFVVPAAFAFRPRKPSATTTSSSPARCAAPPEHPKPLRHPKAWKAQRLKPNARLTHFRRRRNVVGRPERRALHHETSFV